MEDLEQKFGILCGIVNKKAHGLTLSDEEFEFLRENQIQIPEVIKRRPLTPQIPEAE